MIDLIIFIFSFLPSLAVHAFLLFGIIMFIFFFFMGKISDKFISPVYKSLLKYISIFIISLGLFFEGCYQVNNEYMQRAKEWENKVILAEERAKAVNQKIEYVYLDKVREVEKVRYIVKDKIVRVSESLDKDCKVSKDLINILNEAAKK